MVINMMDKLSEYVKSTRGSFIYHNQVVSVVDKGKWTGTNNKNLSGAWTGNSHFKNDKGEDLYGLPGVCFGLIAAYLIKGYNWREFEKFINASEGHRIILGIMNYQAQRPLSIRSARSSKENIQRYKQSIITNQEVFKTVVKARGSVIYQGYRSLPKINDIQARVKMIVDNLDVGYCYEVGIYRLSSENIQCDGHSVAFWVERNVIKFYDPNFGEISYANNRSGIDCFKVAVEIIFFGYYREHKVVEMSRFASPVLTQKCRGKLSTLV